MLEYEKLYQSLKKVSGEWHAGHVEWGFYYDYLRFYQDGIVIRCNDESSEGLDSWFRRDDDKSTFGRGNYLRTGNTISFQIPAPVGVLECEGQIQGNGIILFVKNDLVNYRNVDYFEVVA